MRSFEGIMGRLVLALGGVGAALPLLACLLAGCVGPTSVSWRGVTYMTVQEATTDGSISNLPGDMSGRVDAAKSTEVKTSMDGDRPEPPPEPAVEPK